MDRAESDTGSAAAGKKSFWETLPGLLTGVAAVLSALAGLLTVLHRPSPVPEPVVSHSRHHAPAPVEDNRVQENRTVPRLLNVSGRWQDLNYGTEVRIRQTGSALYSETYNAATGQRVAVGSGRIFGRRIEGPYQWVDGTRYMASLVVSEDGQEITGTSRNLLTGQQLPAHLTR